MQEAELTVSNNGPPGTVTTRRVNFAVRAPVPLHTFDFDVPLHLVVVEIGKIEAMRNAWIRASLGNSPNEAGFYYDGTINPVAHTNQNGKLSFSIPPGTTAVFHTHPQGHDLMSQQDIDVANQNDIDMYVISRSGLYHYRPG